jgi:hypothetical protein
MVIWIILSRGSSPNIFVNKLDYNITKDFKFQKKKKKQLKYNTKKLNNCNLWLHSR